MASYSVFVGHLATETTKEELTALFSECGNVKGVFINPKEEHLRFTFGFVRFSESKAVLKAAQEVGHWTLHGKTLRVEIAHETKKALQLITPKRYPSSSSVRRDQDNRAKVKEACHVLNKELDLIHGDQPVDLVSVLEYLEMRSVSCPPKVQASICPEALNTRESVIDSIGALSAEPLRAIQQKKDVLRQKLSSLKQACSCCHTTGLCHSKNQNIPTAAHRFHPSATVDPPCPCSSHGQFVGTFPCHSVDHKRSCHSPVCQNDAVSFKRLSSSDSHSCAVYNSPVNFTEQVNPKHCVQPTFKCAAKKNYGDGSHCVHCQAQTDALSASEMSYCGKRATSSCQSPSLSPFNRSEQVKKMSSVERTVEKRSPHTSTLKSPPPSRFCPAQGEAASLKKKNNPGQHSDNEDEGVHCSDDKESSRQSILEEIDKEISKCEGEPSWYNYGRVFSRVRRSVYR